MVALVDILFAIVGVHDVKVAQSGSGTDSCKHDSVVIVHSDGSNGDEPD